MEAYPLDILTLFLLRCYGPCTAADLRARIKRHPVIPGMTLNSTLRHLRERGWVTVCRKTGVAVYDLTARGWLRADRLMKETKCVGR